MAFERIAEHRLRQAIADGWLDDLPNRGDRLDLDEYFRTPEEVRLAYSVLKSASCLPEEVELRNEIARLERAMTTAAADDRARLQREAADRSLRLNLLIDQRKKRQRP